MSHAFDLVIRNGVIADGLGGAFVEGDVAIADGRIAQVGLVAGGGAEEIDAKGMLVTPGFVDVHTHYDGQATWENRLAPSSLHGVTTAVMGNCGVGFAPVRSRDHETLIELMEGIEDIPGTALHEGLKWNWESFGEYLDAVAARRFDMDIGAQLPHGPLRLYVMGDRATRLEHATPDEVARMRELARQAVEAGALGFSTSRSFNHKSVKGDLTPSYRAREDELTAIALGLKDAGRGVLQWISDFPKDERAFEYGLIERVARASGRPVSISVGQNHSDSTAWRETLGMIARARADGLRLTAQVAPRPIGMIMGLAATRHPLHRCPSFAAIAEKPLDKQVAPMRDPRFRAKLLAEAAETPPSYVASRLFPMGETPDYGQDPSRSVTVQAEMQGRTADELIYDLLLEDEGANLLFYAAVNYADHDYGALAEMMAAPNAILGLGDGGAHVGMISDASFVTSALTIWGRDRGGASGPSLAEVIRRQTSAPAEVVGLLDRGVVAAGYKADLNVIDLDRLRLERPYLAHDLPSGAKRLMQKARGYAATVVSGAVTYRDGEATGTLPGALIRGAQAAP